MTATLKSGCPGAAHSCDGSLGEGLDRGAGLGGGGSREGDREGCGARFRNVCTVGEVLKGLFLGRSHIRIPRSGLRIGGMCPGMGPPRAQGQVGVLGLPWTPVSALSPPAGAWSEGRG